MSSWTGDPCRASEGVLLASKQIKEPPPWADGKTRLQALRDGLSATVSYCGAEPPARAAQGTSPVMSPGCVNQTRQIFLGRQVSRMDGLVLHLLHLAALTEVQQGEGCTFVPGVPKGMQSTEHPWPPPPLSPCPTQPWGSPGWQWEPVLEGHQSGDAPNCWPGCKHRCATVCPNCCLQTIKYHVMS